MNPLRDLQLALSLLTTLPVPAPADHDAPGRAMAAYPLAGVVIGALLAGLAWGLSALLPAAGAPLLAPALVLAAWVALTGGLHLDGWADCCDALFVPATRERRLEILHDPRLGSFGGIGLATLLIVKLAGVQAVLLGAGGELAGLLPLLAAPALARWGIVAAAALFPPARPTGMAAFFRQGLRPAAVVVATILALAACAPLGVRALPLVAGAAAAWLGAGALATRRLGGLSGDVYGAIAELAETAVLVVAAFTH